MALRRRYSRFEPEHSEVVISAENGSKWVGNISNESYGGLGVQCEDVTGLEEGLEVSVRFEECDYEAVVVSLRPEDGLINVGLKWLEMDAEDQENFDEEEE